jgi:hypothetical protein
MFQLPPSDLPKKTDDIIQTSKQLKQQMTFWDAVRKGLNEGQLIKGIKEGEIVGLDEGSIANVVSNSECTTITFELPRQWALRNSYNQLIGVIEGLVQPQQVSIVQSSQQQNQTQVSQLSPQDPQKGWFSFDKSLIEYLLGNEYISFLQNPDGKNNNDKKT